MVSNSDHYSSSLAVRAPASVVSARSSRAHASSRSKRYNRSHAGGSSYVPQNEFPVFNHSGDVEILITAGGRENRYLLHKHTLTRCSGFFEASTSQEWSKAAILPPPPESQSKELTRIAEDSGSGNSSGNELTRPGASSPAPRRRWRYELDPGTGGDDIPMLIQKDGKSANNTLQGDSLFGGTPAPAALPPASSSRKSGHSHTASSHSFFRSVANLSLDPSRPNEDRPLSEDDANLLRDYDNLFRIFYNYPPMLDGVNIADAYVQCKSLLTLADLYDALAVVGPRVDHHMLQFQSRLWKQIAKYPVSYLRLGYLARSKIIFQEALIHVVGQWPAGERSIRSALPDIVLDIIEDKVDELEETVSRIEGRLFRLSLTNSRGERVTPASSYLDWLAVSFFRQWLAENTAPAPILPPSDSDRRGHGSSRDGPAATAGSRALVPAGARAPSASGGGGGGSGPNLASVGRTYRTLGSVNAAAYLGHDECKRFLKLTPEMYSRDNLRRFEKRIDELKLAAREIVRPLMGSGLELETSVTTDGRSGQQAAPVSYLTCVRVGDGDLPWGAED